MSTAAAKMLTALFEHAADGELINLRVIRKGKPPLEQFFPVSNIAEATEYAARHCPSGDVYFGVLPRVREKGGRADVGSVRVVWADCDSPESIVALQEFPLLPSIVVMSGTEENRHAYWLLDEAVTAEEVEAINRRLAAKLGSDAVVHDRARILRVPGTLNHKHRAPTEVKLAVCSGARYTREEVESTLAGPEHDEPTGGPAGRPPGVDGPTERFLALVDGVTETGNGWMARCPAHDDERPSLSIAEGAGGRCLLHCFAGCRTASIVGALGLSIADLFDSSAADDDGGHQDRPTVARQLVMLADDAGVRLFHNSSHDAFAWVPVDGHAEVWAVKSSRFKRWLRHRLYLLDDRSVKGDAVNEATELLTARAEFDGPEAEVHLRSAWDGDGMVYDLADSCGDAVTVTASGWAVGKQDRAAFLRRDSVLPVPRPSGAGDIARLRQYVNVSTDDEFMLIVAWLVMALRPDGPYPVLVILGPQGSAKSTQTSIHKLLVDPGKAPRRALPASVRDLAIAARSNHVLAFDNVSQLTANMSDAFCRIATGDGFATRELFTDDDEVIFEHTRAPIINGIDAIVTRQDLIGRSIVVRLRTIDPDGRLDETELWRRFEHDRPAILAALLDGAAAALANRAHTTASGFRMADFARWAAAAMPAFGWTPEAFIAAYRENLSDALTTSLDGSIVATAIIRTFEGTGRIVIQGTPADVRKDLLTMVKEDEQRASAFPKNAQALSRQLTLLSPALSEIGITVNATHHGSGKRKVRWITISRDTDGGTQGTGGTQSPLASTPGRSEP